MNLTIMGYLAILRFASDRFEREFTTYPEAWRSRQEGLVKG